MIIAVNDKNHYHLMNNGIGVKPGTMANMVLTKTQTKQIPKQYSNCFADDEIDTILSREMKKLDIPYSKPNCLFMCRQKYNVDTLGCNDMRLPQILNAPPCETEWQYNQLTQIVYNFSQCQPLCPIECKTSSYDVSTSYLEYPSFQSFYKQRMTYYDHYTQLFGTENITYEMFKQSVAGVNIFFDELYILEMSESPKMTVFELMGSLGGTMGLYLGISFMCFVEYIELIIDMCAIAWLNWRLKRQQHKQIGNKVKIVKNQQPQDTKV
jgi:hypothetical protein